VRDSEIVYRDKEDARDGELWKVCNSGGWPSKIMLPRISVVLSVNR
jgi:hypothetical protein